MGLEFPDRSHVVNGHNGLTDVLERYNGQREVTWPSTPRTTCQLHRAVCLCCGVTLEVPFSAWHRRHAVWCPFDSMSGLTAARREESFAVHTGGCRAFVGACIPIVVGSSRPWIAAVPRRRGHFHVGLGCPPPDSVPFSKPLDPSNCLLLVRVEHSSS